MVFNQNLGLLIIHQIKYQQRLKNVFWKFVKSISAGIAKNKVRLEQDGIYSRIPAKSTINNILKRHDLIPERKKHVHIEKRYPKFIADHCHEYFV